MLLHDRVAANFAVVKQFSLEFLLFHNVATKNILFIASCSILVCLSALAGLCHNILLQPKKAS
jgi:hypothetical protein